MKQSRSRDDALRRARRQAATLSPCVISVGVAVAVALALRWLVEVILSWM